MPTITAATITTRAAVILQDTTNVRWPDSELLGWLNDGQRDIVVYKPNACVKNVALQLVPGTKQVIPADGLGLVDVPRNMGLDGATPGRAVRLVSRDVLDAQLPDWHLQSGASAQVKHYMYTELDPRTFYVYPPQPASAPAQVEVIYCASPAGVATSSDVIAVDDIYANVLLDYILYRAYAKDTNYAANPQAATNHYAAYTQALKGKLGGEVFSDPNRRSGGNNNIVAAPK